MDIGVYQQGACRFCGQVITLDVPEITEEAADRAATSLCSCREATVERETLEQVQKAQENITKIFGSGAAECGFSPIEDSDALKVLREIAAQVVKGKFFSAAINLGGSKAKIGLASSGKVKITRSKTTSYQLED